MTAVPGQGRIVVAAGHRPPASITSRPGIVVMDRFGPNGVLDEPLAGSTTVLFSDVLPSNVDGLTGLRWLQLGSAGYAQVCRRGLAERGITVTTASGVNDVPIAEWCVLTMLSLERDFVGMLDNQRTRTYERSVRFQRELRGRTIGVVGYGGIGREVGRMAKAMGLSVWVMNRSPVGPAGARFTSAGTGDPTGSLPDRVVKMGDWAAFLPHLDYLVLAVALNDATRGLLGTSELELVPAHAFLLNPARAQLVDEQALRAALLSGSLAGAALDSHYREPLSPDDDTWDLPTAIVTPHISGSTDSPRYRTRMWELFGENLDRFGSGSPLLNVVPPGDLC